MPVFVLKAGLDRAVELFALDFVERPFQKSLAAIEEGKGEVAVRHVTVVGTEIGVCGGGLRECDRGLAGKGVCEMLSSVSLSFVKSGMVSGFRACEERIWPKRKAEVRRVGTLKFMIGSGRKIADPNFTAIKNGERSKKI
ncbi:MAG: hypothetical protein ACJAVK_003208 [Akkermansiaceae bacterium]|jgi:hypothetical protein